MSIRRTLIKAAGVGERFLIKEARSWGGFAATAGLTGAGAGVGIGAGELISNAAKLKGIPRYLLDAVLGGAGGYGGYRLGDYLTADAPVRDQAVSTAFHSSPSAQMTTEQKKESLNEIADSNARVSDAPSYIPRERLSVLEELEKEERKAEEEGKTYGVPPDRQQQEFENLQGEQWRQRAQEHNRKLDEERDRERAKKLGIVTAQGSGSSASAGNSVDIGLEAQALRAQKAHTNERSKGLAKSRKEMAAKRRSAPAAAAPVSAAAAPATAPTPSYRYRARDFDDFARRESDKVTMARRKGNQFWEVLPAGFPADRAIIEAGNAPEWTDPSTGAKYFRIGNHRYAQDFNM